MWIPHAESYSFNPAHDAVDPPTMRRVPAALYASAGLMRGCISGAEVAASSSSCSTACSRGYAKTSMSDPWTAGSGDERGDKSGKPTTPWARQARERSPMHAWGPCTGVQGNGPLYTAARCIGVPPLAHARHPDAPPPAHDGAWARWPNPRTHPPARPLPLPTCPRNATPPPRWCPASTSWPTQSSTR
jgi:hypothetical protein